MLRHREEVPDLTSTAVRCSFQGTLFTFEGICHLILSYVGAFSHATSEFDKVQGHYLFTMATFFKGCMRFSLFSCPATENPSLNILCFKQIDPGFSRSIVSSSMCKTMCAVSGFYSPHSHRSIFHLYGLRCSLSYMLDKGIAELNS